MRFSFLPALTFLLSSLLSPCCLSLPFLDLPLTPPSPQVIVTSYLFPSAKFSEERLRRLAEKVGKERLVVDVRCA